MTRTNPAYSTTTNADTLLQAFASYRLAIPLVLPYPNFCWLLMAGACKTYINMSDMNG